jgi:two-component system sensor histidine kinase AlgZ
MTPRNDRVETVATHAASPPFWWPLAAGVPIALSLAVMALPELEHRHALIFRAFYLALFLAWTVPLTWLQRRLWARGAHGWTLCGTLLVVTYVMSVLSNAFGRLLGTALGEVVVETNWIDLLDGLDSCWLSLIAFAAVHAVVAHAFELRSERERLARAMAATRDAELHALRYQLQPHFLFNTLNAVSSLVAEGRAPEAQAMIARLGDFLRTTLDARAAHEVVLAEELASAEGYLDIERARLGPRLRVKWQIGTDVLRAFVPALLLQPLVENAIRHGIAPRTTPGRLDIAIDRVGQRLRIAVGNDMAEGASSIAVGAGGVAVDRIGLRNLDERLRALYPGAYRLRAGPGAGARFEVEVELPFRDAPVAAEMAG